MVSASIEGYERLSELTIQEKEAIPCVMKSIEILCAAYFISIKDIKCAKDAKRELLFIQELENELRK